MSDARTRYVILNEEKQVIVRNEKFDVVTFSSSINATDYAAGRYNSWVVLRQIMRRGIWQTSGLG